MSFPRGQAVYNLPIGCFRHSTTNAEVTTGTPTGKITVGGVSDDIAGTISYDAEAGQWVLDELTAAEMDGHLIGLKFSLATANAITCTLVTDPAVEIHGQVDDEAATASSFAAATGLSATDDTYNRLWLVFVSGALQGISRQITDYVGSTRTFTLVDALPAAPADEDRFIIIGHGP